MGRFLIRGIDADTALEIRHRVLWPHLAPDASRVEGDEFAHHLGAYCGETLVGVASIFNDNGARLRKFAVLDEFQGQGVGRQLLESAIQFAQHMAVRRFWCDARVSATQYYQRFGFETEGDVFYKKELAYTVMALALC